MLKNSPKTVLLAAMLLFVIIPLNSDAQELLDLPDFLRITGNSSKNYEFSSTKEPLREISVKGRLNFNYYYLNDSNGFRTVKPFDISMEANELQELGWEAIMMEEPDTALAIFRDVLSMSPDYTPAMTGIGQSLEMTGDVTSAIEWYRKAIDVNPIDYIATWSLSRAMFDTGKKDSAIVLILYSWILNRNSNEIRKDIERILSGAGRNFNDWDFVPQYIIEDKDDKIIVTYNPAWMGYAICQLVWDKEPGFSEGRVIEGDKSMFRERECLSCLINTMDSEKKDSDRDPALVAFKKALKQKMAMEFIIFEILLPENPDMAYLLDSARMQRLVEYIRLTRL